jgi:hypothetical protein
VRLESAQSLKQQLVSQILEPIAARAARVRTAGARAFTGPQNLDPSLFGIGARPFDTLPEIHRSLALGVAPHGGEYRLAIRLQRAALRDSPLVGVLEEQARGEVDIRQVGRIDKRARSRRARLRRRAASRRASVPWYQQNARPLLIGASVGHVEVTAGTLGAFVERSGVISILSNNHVLANEDRAAAGDAILQRAKFDGGARRSEQVARLSHWVRLKRRGSNLVDAAIATLDAGVEHDADLLKGLVDGSDRRLRGVGQHPVDEGDFVYKLGRTTGPTRGRVTAFDLDNVVVNYDVGNRRFDGQIEIEGTSIGPFSDGGDSGSIIVSSRMEAVGLLFAGSDAGGQNGAGLTYANPIHEVLFALKASLLS